VGIEVMQNTSHAVMSQRTEPLDSLDDFPTPPWAARALCEHVIAVDKNHDSLWEPACNRGYLLRGLKDYFSSSYASDISNYTGNNRCDFLAPNILVPISDWIITNPPFRLAEKFAERAIGLTFNGVALLVRTQFLESKGRYHELFSKHPPYLIAQFVERVPMVRGRCDPKASTATAYCWVVWVADHKTKSTEFIWIPPCRKALEREGDYA
jgi:hypothetical protein